MDESRFRERLVAYAALVRVPNLFSAPPDVLLGGALVAATAATVSLPSLAGLAGASVLLYAGGTTLNDYFDAGVDARERPERPIPSGDVSRRAAGALGATLLLGGVLVAFAVAGVRSGALAAALATVITLYDSVLKGGPAGFLAMGSVRGLNILLGTTAAGAFALSTWQLTIPVVIALYIALVTYMAANEATTTNRGAVAGAAAGVLLAALAVLAVVVIRPALTQSAFALAFAGGFLAWTGRALGPAYANPRPGTVGPAVGACILGLVILDSAFAALAGIGWALATLVFLVPAYGLSHLFDVS
ncbi:UbiA family prenyltransferase [Halococcus sediminicola]|uniref:UbiA family prenyltransferase n=1 Tax=Halococcus sediminicola TaxID=1264579 RepID=UPI000679BDAC|nr:UbiA family prenyltransferase [Halococcus sediminicola]